MTEAKTTMTLIFEWKNDWDKTKNMTCPWHQKQKVITFGTTERSQARFALGHWGIWRQTCPRIRVASKWKASDLRSKRSEHKKNDTLICIDTQCVFTYIIYTNTYIYTHNIIYTGVFFVALKGNRTKTEQKPPLWELKKKLKTPYGSFSKRGLFR